MTTRAEQILFQIDRSMLADRERALTTGAEEAWIRQMREELVRTMTNVFEIERCVAERDLESYLKSSGKDERTTLEDLLFEQRFLVATGEIGPLGDGEFIVTEVV